MIALALTAVVMMAALPAFIAMLDLFDLRHQRSDAPGRRRNIRRQCRARGGKIARIERSAGERQHALDMLRHFIRQFLDARPAGRVTRHLCSNIRVDMTGPDTATGGCSALMYHAAVETAVSAASVAQLPLPVSPPVVVDYIDDYVLTSGGWKFKYRRTTVVFQP